MSTYSTLNRAGHNPDQLNLFAPLRYRRQALQCVVGAPLAQVCLESDIPYEFEPRTQLSSPADVAHFLSEYFSRMRWRNGIEDKQNTGLYRSEYQAR